MQGEKIKLRPIEKKDLIKLNQWKNDKYVYQFLGGGYQPISIDQQEKWMDNLIDLTGNNKRFIISTLNDEVIGMIGLYDINWIHRTCEVGLYLGDSNSRGKGYAQEAFLLLENYALNFLNLRKMNLKVVQDNDSAINLWKKLGFSQVGVFHKERYVNRKYCDVILMEKFLK